MTQRGDVGERVVSRLCEFSGKTSKPLDAGWEVSCQSPMWDRHSCLSELKWDSSRTLSNAAGLIRLWGGEPTGPIPAVRRILPTHQSTNINSLDSSNTWASCSHSVSSTGAGPEKSHSAFQAILGIDCSETTGDHKC